MADEPAFPDARKGDRLERRVKVGILAFLLLILALMALPGLLHSSKEP